VNWVGEPQSEPGSIPGIYRHVSQGSGSYEIQALQYDRAPGVLPIVRRRKTGDRNLNGKP